MDDAWGKLILGRSDDCDCDFEQLVVSLNKFQWGIGPGTWILSTDGDEQSIHYGERQHPRTTPKQNVAAVFQEDGSERHMENPSLQERKDAHKVLEHDLSLAQLARELSRHIWSGSIELACIVSKKHRYVYFERNIIRSDGTATRNSIYVYQVGGSYKTTERLSLRYTPPTFSKAIGDRQCLMNTEN